MFLELPLVSHQYPNEIYDLAKRSDCPVDDIAKAKGVEPQPVISIVHLRYDIINRIVSITEDSNEVGSSIIDFEDGDFEIVKVHHRKLAKKIIKFLHEFQQRIIIVSEDPGSTPEDSGRNPPED